MDTHYRRAGTVCGMTILIDRRAGERAPDDGDDPAVTCRATG